MVRRAFVLAVLCACSTPRPVADSAPRAPAAAAAPATSGSAADALDPPQPTLRLPRNFVPAAYRARLAIDPARTDFTGSIEIDGDVRERSKRFWLHGRKLKVSAATISRGGRALRVEVTSVGEDLLSLRPA